MALDQSDFDYWKSSPITQKVFKLFLDLNNDFEELLLNHHVVLGENGVAEYAKAIGSRYIIYRLLNLEFDELDKDEEEINDQEKI